MPRYYDTEITSRLMLGTAQYPSPAILAEAFKRSGAGIATVSVRREAGGESAGQAFWDMIWARTSCPIPPAAIRCARR